MADEAKPTREELLAGVDDFGRMALSKVAEKSGAYNKVVLQIKALDGDAAAMLEHLRENSDNEQVAKLRELGEQLQEKLTAVHAQMDNVLQSEVAQVQAEAGTELEGLKKKEADERKAIMAARTYLKTEYPQLEALIPKLERLEKKPSGGQNGIRRIRGLAWIVGENTYSNTTDASKALKTDTSALQNAYFKACGTEDAQKFPTEVTFTYGENENAVSVTVRKTS